MLIDRDCDPPSPVLPWGEVRLPIQSARRDDHQPHGGAAGDAGGQGEAGEDEESRMKGTQKRHVRL